jgi:hypothetical protein
MTLMKEGCVMNITREESITVKPTHPWLRKMHVAFVPGPMTPLLKEVMDGLKRNFRRLGHQFQTAPDDHTDVILTTAPFGEPLHWRKSLTLFARRRFNLSRTPTVYTLVQVSPTRFQELLDHFQTVLAKEPPNPADYDFPGLAPQAYRVLFEQGRRGGPILALERVVQAQTKSIRVLLVVGDDPSTGSGHCRPLEAYHFDLVGAHPRSEADDLEAFYEDIVLRTVTTLCTSEVNQHQVVGDPIPRSLWRSIETPAAMCEAAQRLGNRNFFTKMVHIADLVEVPVVTSAVAEQYSEGCFATWDPTLGALIATVTGSARPVHKGSITEDDLAVIVGVRSDGQGALVRQVEGKHNDPPSTEAVEMMDMDSPLPAITLAPAWGISAQVPVVRSKLHGHRGMAAYDPRYVEFAPLDPPYYHYLVSCGTGAQAQGIKDAFTRSEALQNPQDPRQVVFTVLPGHGIVIVEKWVSGTTPFQVMWEYMDAGYLEVENLVPQGPMEYVCGPDGRMLL